MKCLKCNNEIPSDSEFCPYCGEKVNVKTKCQKCNEIIPSDSEFCPYCGTSVLNVKKDESHKSSESTTKVKKSEKKKAPKSLFVAAKEKKGIRDYINKTTIIVSSLVALAVISLIVGVSIIHNNNSHNNGKIANEKYQSSSTTSFNSTPTTQKEVRTFEEYMNDQQAETKSHMSFSEFMASQQSNTKQEQEIEETQNSNGVYVPLSTVKNNGNGTDSANGTTPQKTTKKESTTKSNFKTLTYRGSGVDSITNINVPEGDYYIICSYNGESNFMADLYSTASAPSYDYTSIANTIGTSKTVCGFSGSISNGYINIKFAKGDWTITIEKCQPKITSNRLSYSGSGITGIKNINLPEGQYYIKCYYYGESNFMADFYDSASAPSYDYTSIANMVGEGSSTTAISGPVKNGYIQIKFASGDWKITIEPC